MKRILILALLLTAALASAAQPTAELERVVRALQQQEGMQHATLSVCVYDAVQGHRLYGYEEHRTVCPASVQKLLTTGAFFARLGSDFRFTTRLLMQGDVDRDGVLHGDLYIVGGGDPLLGSYRYRQTHPDTLFALWTEALHSRGLKRVDGRIRYVTSLFSGPRQHDTWQHGDVGNYYGCGAAGLNFHENMYFVHFDSGLQLGDPAPEVRTVPKNLSLVETNRVTTGPAGSGDGVVVYGLGDSRERLYTGTVPLGSTDFGIRAALPDPPRACADLFATYLRGHGISVTMGSEEAEEVPDSVRIVSEYLSSSYKLIAQYTNLMSNNLYAEALFKYLGYRSGGSGDFEGGARAVSEYLEERGVESSGVRIVDGSGLSRLNGVTTDFLCRYLVMLKGEPFYNDFLLTLRTGNNPAVCYKTGSMDGLCSQAGYIRYGGRVLAYSVVINNADQSRARLTDKVNAIVDAIVMQFAR